MRELILEINSNLKEARNNYFYSFSKSSNLTLSVTLSCTKRGNLIKDSPGIKPETANVIPSELEG